MHLLKAYKLWGLQVEGVGFPQILVRGISKDFEVQERARDPLSPRQIWWDSDFTRHHWVFCLVFCSCLRHTFEGGVYAYDFAMKLLEYRNGFDAIG